MIQELSLIKEQLFDAPSDVKQAFNDVINYFDGKGANFYTVVGVSRSRGFAVADCYRASEAEKAKADFLRDAEKHGIKDVSNIRVFKCEFKQSGKGGVNPVPSKEAEEYRKKLQESLKK